jgi:hypothetical protein
MDPEDAFCLLTYGGGAPHLVPRPPTYAAALELVKAEFDILDGTRITLSVNWKGRRANVSERAFTVVARAEEVFVTIHPPLPASAGARRIPTIPVVSGHGRPYDRPDVNDRKINIEVHSFREDTCACPHIGLDLVVR